MKAHAHSNPKPSVKFHEIDSSLRDDTSTKSTAASASGRKAAIPTQTRSTTVAATEVEDGDINDGMMNPWLDHDKPKTCGHAAMFDVESWIDLDRPELLGILSSNPNTTASDSKPQTESDQVPRDNGMGEAASNVPVDWSFSLSL